MAEPLSTRAPRRRARALILGAVVVLAVTLLATGRLSSPPRTPVSYAGCPEAKVARSGDRYPAGEAPSARARRTRPGGLVVGIHATLRAERGGVLCRVTDLARRSGAEVVREDLDWRAVEPRAGRLDWRRYDAIFAVAARRGLTVLPIVGSTPAWAGPRANAPPRDARTYARFLARSAARYGPGGAFWRDHPELPRRPATQLELYNEPFLPAGDEPGPDPAAYARLVREAVPAARRANPRVRFLIAGETTWTTDFETYRPWMDALYAAVPDLGRYFDAVSVHPYSADPPAHYAPGGNTRWQSRRLEQVRQTLTAHGDAGKPLFVTEIGWSTCPDHPDCVTEAQQAAYLRSFFALARARWSYVPAVFVYHLRDHEGDGDDKEAFYGLIHADGSPKPAWRALRQLDGAL
jgi:polysaccharide biosynthesis protein PslG